MGVEVNAMEETDKLEELMSMVAKIEHLARGAQHAADGVASQAYGASCRAKDAAKLAIEAAQIVSRLQDEKAREERDGSVQ